MAGCGGTELSAYLDGALSADERTRLELHLASCGRCRADADSLAHLKAGLAAAPRRSLPPDLALRLQRRAQGRSPWAALARPVVWAPVGALAAALAFALWAGSPVQADDVPLESLLAAHDRYSAETLVPRENLVAAGYSGQLNALYGGGDADLE